MNFSLLSFSLIPVLLYSILALFFKAGHKRKYKIRTNDDLFVSVIVSARNEAANIKSCLISLDKLNYPNHLLEIYIVNDRSEDETHKIISEFIKGKPCFKPLFTFLGKVFIDCKLCPGKSNPKVYFQKMVKRAISMGHKFFAVCGDAAFGNVQNVLFLTKLSLHYALGSSKQLGIVSDGIETFKKLRRKGVSKIIGIKKGIHFFDYGFQYIGQIGFRAIYTRVIIGCRIHRRRNKKGKLKVRYYYYSIITDLDWSLTKVIKYYRTRQNIENAIKEIKYHYSLNRMPHRNRKANEFYIASRILAMSMVKLFQLTHLPKSLQSMRRKTLIRKVFASALLKVGHNAPYERHITQ